MVEDKRPVTQMCESCGMYEAKYKDVCGCALCASCYGEGLDAVDGGDW